ncbi:unnamed protein product [Trichogramma brassicae]|uniref:Peptidase S1 domain-containing protein n=1 Tax=Trichogramma brassicae TaxID=86971 RepID=A0A6H5J2U8_9HYME|nr:unnamed protein product [Trichogramma brassicae]
MKHQRTVHESCEDFTCDKCEKKFVNKFNLVFHQKTVHEGRKDYECYNCEKKFGHKQHLFRHQKTFHEGRKDFACDRCEKKFGEKGTLIKHQKTIHEGRRDFACDKCDKKYRQKHHLLIHQKTAHEGHNYNLCDKCDKKFGQRSDLFRHQRTVHEGCKDYVCDKCEKKFGQKLDLLKHRRTVHEGRKDFVCDECEKKFGQKQYLLIHQKTVHEGRRNYTYHKDSLYDKCEQKFGEKSNLIKHQKTVHEDRKDYSCDKCEKKFGYKVSLLYHQKTIHEARKDHRCDKCEKKFGHKVSLLYHQKTIHEGRKDHRCDKCEKKFGHKLNGSLGLATNPNLRALELPRDQLLTYDDEEVLISGFGITWLKYYMAPSSPADGTAASSGHQSPAVVDGELSARLRYARADVIPTQACRKIYKRRQPVYYVQICTRLRQREYSRPEGVCVGDSGGPVVHNNRTIVGVVSRGPLSCSELVVPARHTRVSPFVRFIDHAVHGTHDPDMMARHVILDVDGGYDQVEQRRDQQLDFVIDQRHYQTHNLRKHYIVPYTRAVFAIVAIRLAPPKYRVRRVMQYVYDNVRRILSYI